MKKKNFNLPKIHLACTGNELRPAMNHVLVNKEDIVASDAHILCVHKTKDYFTEEFIDAMPESMLIHRKNWQLLTKNITTPLQFKNNQIEIWANGYKLLIPIDDKGLKFPNYKAVIPEIPKERNPISTIGISGRLLSLLERAMNCEYCGLKLELISDYQAILCYSIESDEKSFGIIMPKTFI